MTYQNDYLRDRYSSDHKEVGSVTRVQSMVSAGHTNKPRYGLRKILLGSSILCLFIYVFIGQLINSSFVVMFSSAPSDIKQIGRDAGLSMLGQSIFLSNNPEFLGSTALASVCPQSDESVTFGCYLPTENKIYILDISDNELRPILLTSVAHEVLHAVHRAMPSDQKQQIDSELVALYKGNVSTTLSTDAELYKNLSAPEFSNELHSLAGSEVDMTIMSDILREHYHKYFSDQTKPVSANQEFDNNIKSQIDEIKAQSDQLDADSAKLDLFRSEHLTSIEQAMEQNAYYGDSYTYNKNVDAFNHNREIYNNMVSTYNDKLTNYNEKQKRFAEAYAALFPDKSIPVPAAK